MGPNNLGFGLDIGTNILWPKINSTILETMTFPLNSLPTCG